MKSLAAFLLLCTCVALGQSQIDEPQLQKGAHELSFWVSGGRGTTGRTSDTGVLIGAVRYGWVLTAPHGPGPLRGTFEAAVDAVPMFLVFQSSNAYGAGINPLVLKWNFQGKKVAPYLELNGGTLFTTEDVPTGTSRINFTSGAALGFRFGGRAWSPSLAIRYMHISNAGLSSPNPGVNTVQLTVGIGRFR